MIDTIYYILGIMMYIIIYNLTWVTTLILFFILIYTLIHKFNMEVKVLHSTFDFFDILYNWQLSILFLDFPKTYNETISSRARRYVKLEGMPLVGTPMNIFRYETATLLAKLLNSFDEGHI